MKKTKKNRSFLKFYPYICAAKLVRAERKTKKTTVFFEFFRGKA